MPVATDPPWSCKVGDLARAIRYQLLDGNGAVVDLTGASSVQFAMAQNGTGTKTVSGAATVVDAVDGIVAYQWAEGDTDTAGSYRAEFTVIWPTALPDTFPSNAYIDVEIEEKA